MTAKKATAKKPAVKKQSKARARSRASSQLPVPMPDRTPEDMARIIEECDAKAEKWRAAWRMQTMGVPERVMAERLGVKSPRTAAKYADNWVRLLEGDPLKASERARILARLDDMADRMTAELVRLDAAEAGKENRAPVWLDNSKPLLDVLALRWRIVAPRDQVKPQQVTVEVAAGAQAGATAVPDALSAVLAKVTITEGEAA